MGKKIRRKTKINYDIAGILFIVLGLFSLMSLFTASVGAVGKACATILKVATGEGRYIFPILPIILGVTLMRRRSRDGLAIKLWGAISLYVWLITFIHFMIPLEYSLKAGLEGEGGGIIGSVFYYIFHRSFGRAGSYILIAAFSLISLTMITGISPAELIKKVYLKTKNSLGDLAVMLRDFLFIEVEEDEGQHYGTVIINQNGKEIAVFDAVSEQTGVSLEEDASRRTRRKKQNKHIRDLPADKEEANDDGMEVNISGESSNYQLPPITILDKSVHKGKKPNRDISDNIKVLEETLRSFGINARVTQVSCGPTITRYEIQPPSGVKVSRIVALADDIALGMAAQDVRIEAPIPGKAAVGIEVPNKEITMVHLRELLETKEFKSARSHLSMALGKDIAGKPIIADLSRMPHLLIAGATGSGKSVCLNTLIASVLFKSTPSDVKLLIIDPKMVELTAYNGIPHLISPVVTNPKKAATSLRWAVKEMEGRYAQFAEAGVRDIFRYNNQFKKTGKGADKGLMPLIIVIIDELADLMMIAPADVEDAICRLAQMARAAGIHLLVATQRPSVDVITGLIKANIPSRISFAVSSQSDSRTILDMGGAEKLLGKGDMLYYPVGASKPIRVQGAFLSDKEVEALVDYLKKQDEPEYDEQILKADSKETSVIDEDDELLPKAVETLIQTGHASISMLQRRLRIGYARAARLIDIMERNGIVGGYEGSKPRAILMTMEEYKDKFGKK